MMFNEFEADMVMIRQEKERLMKELDGIKEALERNKLMALSTTRPPTTRVTSTAMKAQNDTITYSVNENRSNLIGGRNHSEKITPLFVDNFVEAFVPTLSQPIAVFFEGVGIKKPVQEIVSNEFASKTPYSFTKNNGIGMVSTMDDNVLINTKRGTVLKFLRSKESISGFLLSVYMCAKHPQEFKAARCLAYYPGVMCAEYEYAGDNLDNVMARMRATGNNIGLGRVVNTMNDIILRFREYGGLYSPSVRPFNFCMDLVTGDVKMTCVEWMIPTHNQ